MGDVCASVIFTRKSAAQCLLGRLDSDEQIEGYDLSLRTCPSTRFLVQPENTIANCSCPTVRNIRSRIAIAIMPRNEVQVRGYFRRGGSGAGGLHEAVFEPGHTHNSR
jgi:hypothetical protein